MEKVERKSGRGLARTKRAKEQLGWQALTFESAIISSHLVIMNALALNTCMYNELKNS